MVEHRVLQKRAGEIGFLKISADQLGAAQIGRPLPQNLKGTRAQDRDPREPRRGQRSAREIGVLEIRSPQIRAREIGFLQIAGTEIGEPQRAAPEFCPFQTGIGKIGGAEFNAREVEAVQVLAPQVRARLTFRTN